jgi:hypothetical protein
MSANHDPEKLREHTGLLAIFTLFLFATPLTLWWASPAHPWFLPYLFWLLIIILCAVINYRFSGHDL